MSVLKSKPRLALTLGLLGAVAAGGFSWPLFNASRVMQVEKTAGLAAGDPFWCELVSSNPQAASVTLRVNTYATPWDGAAPISPPSGTQVRYMVHGVPVSDWLNPPYTFTLSLTNPLLDPLEDGVHDLNIDVNGTARDTIKPHPAFLHLARGRPLSPWIPILSQDQQATNGGDDHLAGGVFYVRESDRSNPQYDEVGFPMNPNVTPWHNSPVTEDLYLEQMQPHSELFHTAEMWWEQESGPHQGAHYIRGMPPKHDEDHRNLRVTANHQNFPFRDGPRGASWMSGYTSGKVDSSGGYAFVEPGGRLGYLRPDGHMTTLAGWVTQPGHYPVWWGRSNTLVHTTQELRGQWLNGQYAGEPGGFRTPLDVAIDPNNEKIWYVVGYEDNCIWKVVIQDMVNLQVAVSVFAGDVAHAKGTADGTGLAARFNGPSSIIFDPKNDVLYVADQDNDAIRKITRAGVVTTLFSSPGIHTRLGVDQTSNRTASRFEVTAAQAAGGTKPDIFLPQCIRVDSQGNIIVLELGFGSIRRINPATGETKNLGNPFQKYADPATDRGWAWLDVDRWGNVGPLDSIYWCEFVGHQIDGVETNYNEVWAWLPPAGGTSVALFPMENFAGPKGWGRRTNTNPPHYPWLVAIDPRGAVLLSGGGGHGLSRLRVRRADDPFPTDVTKYGQGQDIWNTGNNVNPAFPMKFGWNAHNYLGFTDMFNMKGATDAQLIAGFQLPADITGNASTLSAVLYFLRSNLTADSIPPGTLPPPPPSGSACDVNNDGSANVLDVQAAVNQAIGTAPCTADINQDGSCNVIDVQRVVNAALGGACVTQ